MEPVDDGGAMSDDVWREFFDGYAPRYMSEVFTSDSVREAAFVLMRRSPA
jgi:hypothetical protein